MTGILYEQDDTDNMMRMTTKKSWHHDIVSAWNSNNLPSLDQSIAEHFEVLQKEMVHGLVQKLRKSLIEKKIRDLNATYLTLGFQEIANKNDFKTEELEPFISRMIAEGQINAKINKKQQTVDFMECDSDLQTNNSLVSGETLKLVNKLESQSARIVSLMELVNKQRQEIRLSELYMTQKVTKSMNMDLDEEDSKMDQF